jgi:hypothetical protein
VSVWPLAYAPFAVVGVWLLMKAVRDLPRPFAILGICGVSCYVLVLGVELSALLGEDAVTLAIEENLELLGTGAILIALGSELINRFGTLFVRTTERAATAPADVAAVVGAAPTDGIAAPAMPPSPSGQPPPPGPSRRSRKSHKRSSRTTDPRGCVVA